MGKTGAERLRESRERKKQKKREYNARFYVTNRKEERRKKRPRIVVEQERERKAPKPKWRLYKAKQRARKKAENEKKASTNVPVSPNAVRGAFPNRTSRKRAVDTTRTYLPSSPRKKVAVIASLVESPKTQHTLQRLGYLNSPENQDDERMASAILEDAKTALQATTKRKRSNDARAATHFSLSVLSAKRGLALSPEIMIEKQV